MPNAAFGQLPRVRKCAFRSRFESFLRQHLDLVLGGHVVSSDCDQHSKAVQTADFSLKNRWQYSQEETNQRGLTFHKQWLMEKLQR